MRRDLIISILLVLAVCAVFGQTARHDFLSFDDSHYVTANPMVQGGLTLDGLRWSFRTFEAEFWHPLTWISIMLDCEWFGLDAGKHHLVSAAYHALAAVLLYLVFRLSTGTVWPGFLVAGLFALHPLHVESVVWAAQRKDVLSGVFWMLTLLFYIWFIRMGSWWRYGMALAAFVAGLMAKPMLVTMPIVMLLFDFWPLERLARGSWRRIVWEKIPFLALALAAGLATIHAQAGAVTRSMTIEQRWARITNGLWTYVDYVGDFLWPGKLSPFYPLTGGPFWLGAIVGVLVLAGMTCICIRLRGRRPYLLTGWLWYVLTLVPVMGFFRGMEFAKADRYTYLTHIGLYVMVAWGLRDLFHAIGERHGCGRRMNQCYIAAVGVVLVACSAVSFRQVGYWKNTVRLFSRAAAVSPPHPLIYSTLAAAQINAGRIGEARASAEAALALNPGFAVIHGILGEILVKEGRIEDGIAEYNLALRLDPKLAKANFELINVYRSLGHSEKMLEHLEMAVQMEPDQPSHMNNLAWFYATHDDARLRNAGRAVQLAQRVDQMTGGGIPEYLDTLAAAYAEAGDFGRAAETMDRALKLAEAAGLDEHLEGLRLRLELFQSGRPFRSDDSGARRR